jgi:hypothetical protein
MASPDLKARPVHYALAHHALRSVALDDPFYYLGVLASPEARKFLKHLLQQCVAHSPPGTPLEFTADDLKVHTGRVGGYPCAIVELPEPVAMPEAYFTAAVLLAEFVDVNDPKNAPVRYFTLEQSFDLEGHPCAMMCEWTKEGTHSNFGGGPPPQLGEFVKAIEHLLGKEGGS